jgi:excinuclease ABC subunit B
MYADKITNSIELTISETQRRREKQIQYNTKNGITPTQIKKKLDNSLIQNQGTSYSSLENQMAAEENLDYLSKGEIEKRIKAKRKDMEQAAKNLDFLVAAQLRDEIETLKKQR